MKSLGWEVVVESVVCVMSECNVEMVSECGVGLALECGVGSLS